MPFAPRRALLLMDNRFDPNWGSQTTTTELVLALEREYPGIEIRGIDRAQAGRHRWQRTVGNRLAWNGPLTGWRNPITRLAVPLLTSGWGDAIEWADLIVVNGEGTLHPQRQTRTWMPLIDWVRRKSGAPTWVVNCSIDFDDAHAPLFRAVLGAVDRIVCREPISFELCAKQGWNAVQGADCAFLAEPAPVDTILRDRGLEGPYAVFTGSVLSREWPADSVHSWLNAIRDRGLRVVWTSSTITDDLLIQRIDPNASVLTHNDLSYREWIGLIDGAAMHFGGRYHATLLSAKCGTPFITLDSNTHKMTGLLRLLEFEGPVYGFDQPSALVEAIQSLEIAKKNEHLIKRCRDLSVQALRNVRMDAPV